MSITDLANLLNQIIALTFARRRGSFDIMRELQKLSGSAPPAVHFTNSEAVYLQSEAWVILSKVMEGKLDLATVTAFLETTRKNLEAEYGGTISMASMAEQMPADEGLNQIVWTQVPVRDEGVTYNSYSTGFPYIHDKCADGSDHQFSQSIDGNTSSGAGIHCLKCHRPLADRPHSVPVLM